MDTKCILEAIVYKARILIKEVGSLICSLWCVMHTSASVCTVSESKMYKDGREIQGIFKMFKWVVTFQAFLTKRSSIYHRFVLVSFWTLLAPCEAALAERWASTIHKEYFKLSTSFIKINYYFNVLFFNIHFFFFQFCTVCNKICDACEEGMTSLSRLIYGLFCGWVDGDLDVGRNW